MEKEKIPEGFREAVRFICNNADVIIDMLNRLMEDYLLGKDIRDSLRSLKNKHRSVFTLIHDILSHNKKIIDWLSQIELEDDKRWVFSKLASYSILKSEFDAVWFEEFGFVNPVTSTEIDYEYNDGLQIPFIEVKALSYGKEILYFKEPLEYLLWLIINLTEKSLESLKKFSDKPIRRESIPFMKEMLENIIEKSKEMLRILNGLSGGEE